jgi:hypothetical protein
MAKAIKRGDPDQGKNKGDNKAAPNLKINQTFQVHDGWARTILIK